MISRSTKQFIRILVIDDHMMVRDGLRTMLCSLSSSLLFRITEASGGEEAMHKLEKLEVDLVIIDYHMPGLSGAETIQRILRYRKHTRILALSNYDELPYIHSMMEAGACGFVLKSIEPAELLIAIRAVLGGKRYYSSDVAVKLLEEGSEKIIAEDKINSLLTGREKQVLQLIAMEMTNEEIAAKLFVARRTVDSHRQNLLHKLQVRNTAGLVKVALRLKLIKV